MRLVLVLIDSRLTPQPIDISFVSWLGECSVPFALVFTKADKQSPKKDKWIDPSLPRKHPATSHRRSTNHQLIEGPDRRIEILKLIEHTLASA